MGEATERIVNLGLHLAAAGRPLPAEEIRLTVPGYENSSEDAFKRMFERDKSVLREAGLVIGVTRDEGAERYFVDARASYADPVDLGAKDLLRLRAAGAAMLGDPSFPYREDLAFALTKLMAGSDSPLAAATPVASALTADEDPAAQGAAVAALTAAAEARKRVGFGYTGAAGKVSAREVEPWGLFAREGRWYLVAHDPAADGVRVFAVPRIRDLTINTVKPGSPDFSRPADFDIDRWMLMPFQYGAARIEVTVRFAGAAARRAGALTAGQGTLEPDPDGTITWRVPVADEALFARWVVENGPGITVIAPDRIRDALRAGLRDVAAAHG